MTRPLKKAAQQLCDEISQKATQPKALGWDVDEIIDNVRDINRALVENNG